jgi:hypothetical protein
MVRRRGKKEMPKCRARFSFPKARNADERLKSLRAETDVPDGDGIFGERTVYLYTLNSRREIRGVS